MEDLEILSSSEAESVSPYLPLRRQILASLGPLIIITSSGMVFGFTGTLLPQLEADDSQIHITKDQSSWIASVELLPMAIGCIPSGIMYEKLGAKITHIILAIPLSISWILMGAAINFEIILGSRLLGGFCIGIQGAVGAIYIAEISEPKYRKFLLPATYLAIATGTFLSQLLGTLFTWQVAAFASSVIPVLCIVTFMFLPESHMWLINKGRIADAKQAFYWFRGSSMNTVRELQAIMDRAAIPVKDKTPWSGCVKSEFLKPLLIIVVCLVTTQFSGSNIIMIYSNTVMKDAFGEGFDEYAATLIIDTLRIIFAILACFVNNKCGRRILVSVSCGGIVFCIIILSSFMYASKVYPAIANYYIIPIGAFAGHLVFSTLGLIPLSCSVTGELLPLKLRGLAGCISTAINYIAMFVAVKTNPALSSLLQPYGAFLVYGAITLIGGSVLYAMLPETKGKTLQEIEDDFK